MKGLLERGQLKALYYTDNELGVLSVKYICKFLEMRNSIDHLVLSNITTNAKTMVQLLNATNDRKFLRKLRISGVSLPEKACAKLPDPDEPETINECFLYDELVAHV